MDFKIFDYLPQEAKEIRTEVFCDEQGFKCEFDETDGISVHIVAYENSVPVAVCRIYPKGENAYGIGRIAVVKAFRGKKIGVYIITEAEKYIRGKGGKEICVSAQVRVKEFHEKQGYLPVGTIYYDEACPHIKMIKKL